MDPNGAKIRTPQLQDEGQNVSRSKFPISSVPLLRYSVDPLVRRKIKSFGKFMGYVSIGLSAGSLIGFIAATAAMAFGMYLGRDGNSDSGFGKVNFSFDLFWGSWYGFPTGFINGIFGGIFLWGTKRTVTPKLLVGSLAMTLLGAMLGATLDPIISVMGLSMIFVWTYLVWTGFRISPQ